MRSEYLKDNPNTRGIREDYWTEEQVQKSRQYVEDFKATTNDKPHEYSLNIAGDCYVLEYEEMVEILAALRTCALGNEAFIAAKMKSEIMMESLPITDY